MPSGGTINKTKEAAPIIMTAQQQEVQQNNAFTEQPTMQLNQEAHPAFEVLQNEIEEQMPLETAEMDESMQLAEKAYEEVHGKKCESKGTRWNIKRNVKRKKNRVSNLKQAENAFEAEKQKMDINEESVYKELEDFDLSVLQVKNDDEFIEKYDKLSRAIYLAEQAKKWIGRDGAEKDGNKIVDVPAVLARITIEKFRPFFEAKKQIIKNPYYVLLRRSDIQKMSQEEKQQRRNAAQEAGNQELADFYEAVLHMESLKEKGNYLKEPEKAIEAAKTLDEQEKWKQEARSVRHEYLMNRRLEREKDPKVIEELKIRTKWSAMARQADENQKENRSKKQDMLEEKIPGIKEVFGSGQRQWFAVISPHMSDEQLISRYKKLSSSDVDVRSEEIIQVFKEYIEMDLSCFKFGSAEAVMTNIEDNLWLLNAGFQLAGLMEWALKAGLKIPMELREQLWKRYEFFCRISKAYKSEVEVLQHMAYDLITEDEMPKTLEDCMMLMETGEYAELKDMTGKIATGMMEIPELTLDKTIPVEEQWKTHTATPMKNTFYTMEEREQMKKLEEEKKLKEKKELEEKDIERKKEMQKAEKEREEQKRIIEANESAQRLKESEQI